MRVHEIHSSRQADSVPEFERAEFIQNEKVARFDAFKQCISPLQCVCHHLPIGHREIAARFAPAIRKSMALPAGKVQQVNADLLVPVHYGGRGQPAQIQAEMARTICQRAYTSEFCLRHVAR